MTASADTDRPIACTLAPTDFAARKDDLTALAARALTLPRADGGRRATPLPRRGLDRERVARRHRHGGTMLPVPADDPRASRRRTRAGHQRPARRPPGHRGAVRVSAPQK